MTSPHSSYLSSGGGRSSGNSNSNNNNSLLGPRSKCDQVVFEAMCKACEVIVGSRTTLVVANNNNGNNVGSSRFNLQVPEVASVRSILSQYHRQQLFVPIRLDVFYQTTDEPTGQVKRDLLERWALHYAPVSSSSTTSSWEQRSSSFPPQSQHDEDGYFMTINSGDPMVQLTHVCRRIVLWLRTLYCGCRLLPAQTIGSSIGDAKKIGFSVYLHNNPSSNNNGSTTVATTRSAADHNNKHDTDDDLRLPGFIVQDFAKPVTTPYGVLTWKVAYCSNIEKWIPKRRSVRIVQSPSQPIPMNKHQQQRYPSNQQQLQQGNAAAAASAPTTSRQQLSYTERSQQRHMLQTGKSFDPSSIQHQQQQQQHNLLGPAIPVRRTSSNIVPSTTTTMNNNNNPMMMMMMPRNNNNNNRQPPPIPENGDPPERVMSGLSLAMMGAAVGTNNNNNHNDPSFASSNSNHSSSDHGDGVLVPPPVSDQTTAEEQARRAALHEVPPHMREQNYGYAYNNHINWQKLQQQQQTPLSLLQLQQQQQRAASPLLRNPVFGTPPGAAFLAPMPTATNNPMSATPPPMHLFRSRSRSDSGGSGSTSAAPPIPPLTPPFPPRPTGFVTNYDRAPLRPFADPPPPSDHNNNGSQLSHPHHHHHNHHHSMMTMMMEAEHPWMPMASTGPTDLANTILPSSLMLDASSSAAMVNDMMLMDDMPFAINTAFDPDGGGGAGASASLVQLAQKCTGTRLKLFDEPPRTSSNQNNKNDLTSTVADLTSQLESMRAFGESLHEEMFESSRASVRSS